ncbi:hypothetical protein JCM10908_003163 [Rhodotorula pacifica]|uniref:dioxygenase BNA2 n=1 Tax=Rhodotorula pacifica TaxID=1495444 RepID=UPI003181AB2C
MQGSAQWMAAPGQVPAAATTPIAGPSSAKRRRVPFPIYEEEDDEAARLALQAQMQQLPSNHFLAQRPVTPPRPESVIDAAWSDRARPDTSSLAAADYDVSVLTGFLPPEEPVQSLRGIGYGWDELEEAFERVQHEAEMIPGGGVGKLSEAFRSSIKRLPTASVEPLTTLPLLRRAHTLLAHLAHFYMHSTFPSQTVMPACLAVPLVQVSDRLGLPPILTYADTVLWTWRLRDKALGLRADNVEMTTLFTSSSSEHAFFALSFFCELYGPDLLRLMSASLDEAFFADATALTRISNYLGSISRLIDELTALMAGATKGEFGPAGRERISPEAFYWEIRPWFNGGRWTYEGVGEGGKDLTMEWGGPSAGQSTLVHALDLFLGIDHAPRRPPTTTQAKTEAAAVVVEEANGTRVEAPAVAEDKAALHKAPSDATFMQRMSHYMPGHHRSFLRHLESLHSPNPAAPAAHVLPSLRQLARQHPHRLGPAYDQAVAAMKRFRDMHMRLATVFIVQQARREPARESVHWPEWEAKRIVKEREREQERRANEAPAAAPAQAVRKQDKIAGTGGTDLVTFLKLCRDRTTEALLGSSSSST